MPLRILEVQQNVLRKNSTYARDLRERFDRAGAFVVNLLSSPGSGKTTLLEETLGRLQPEMTVAALVGDQATDNDALRLARSGAPVRQITTGAECRLDAQMITSALEGFLDRDPGLLVIENVGNLICPAEYDLGEDLRVVLFSVTEGEDKPLKYPLAFTSAQVAVISKIDLAAAVDFDRDAAVANVRRVNPSIEIFELSARSGAGVPAWLDLLRTRVEAKQRMVASVQ